MITANIRKNSRSLINLFFLLLRSRSFHLGTKLLFIIKLKNYCQPKIDFIITLDVIVGVFLRYKSQKFNNFVLYNFKIFTGKLSRILVF